MRVLIMSLLLIFSISTYANDLDNLVGTWSYFKSISADETVDPLFGANTTGYLIYTREGIMSVQLMSRPNVGFASNQSIQQGTQNISDEYLAYSGHYDVDEEKHIVTHHLELAMLPEMLNKDYQRFYQFKGNYLYLTVVDTQKKGRVIVWKKLSA